MLVLTRRVNERIRLTLPDGRVAWITLCDIDRTKCRIGLTFPEEVKIYREELVPIETQVTEDGHAGKTSC